MCQYQENGRCRVSTGNQTETDVTDRAGLRCAVCPHPREAHDRIGLRYCNATAAGSLSRGCVCVGATVQKETH